MSKQQRQAVLLEALAGLDAGSFEHINGPLISHLKNTQDYLLGWGNREALGAAGLYHAVYSTDGYSQQLINLDYRSQIVTLIGAEAETIVYHYAACDRDYVYPRIGKSEDCLYRDRFTGQECLLKRPLFCDLLELTLANELEIVSSNREFKTAHRDWYVELFDRFQPFVSRKAFQSYREVFSIAYS